MAVCLLHGAMMMAAGQFKVAALNVDGMPKSIKIMGVADLTLNPDAKEAPGALAIGEKLVTMGYDIVALEENFNFNDELMSKVNSVYMEGTHRGGIEVDAGTYGRFIIQQTLFDTDGLNILCRKGVTSFDQETWVGWNDRSGYTDNGADRLIDKGYRFYEILVHDTVPLDLYIVHMDAETDEGSQAARESNIRQVTSAVLQSQTTHPVIIMGDWNCRYNRDRLKECCIDALNADPRFSAIDVWVEHEYDSIYPDFIAPADWEHSLSVHELGYQKGEVVDKIIYVNNVRSPYYISADYYLQDVSFVNEQGEPLADHWPVVTTFSYVRKEMVPGSDVVTDPSAVHWQGENPTAGGDYHIFHPYTGRFLSITGSSLSLSEQPSFLWQMSYISDNNGVYTMQMKGGGYWFNLSKNGGSAVPKLSTSEQTTQVSLSGTNTDYPAYKIHRTANPARFLNCNGTEFTGAQNRGEQNDWVFISHQQYNDSCPQPAYIDPVEWLEGRGPNPYIPDIASRLDNATCRPGGAEIIWYRGMICIRRGDEMYNLNGQKL